MLNLANSQFGAYLITNLLGEGDFAEVYLAEHERSKSLVSLKILKLSLVNDLQRIFIQAASTMAHLDYPTIVRILDVGEEVHGGEMQQNHYLYFAMSYAPLGSARQQYPSGTNMPLDRIVYYTQQIASALQFAHLQGLIHQRLKPENILFSANDAVLVSDFGFSIGPLLTSQASLSSVLYTAPEQITGNPHLESDQYALGAIVYEWISGTPPFIGTSDEIIEQHLRSKPLPFHERGLKLSPAVEQVVMRALEKIPWERFPDITSFALALEKASSFR